MQPRVELVQVNFAGELGRARSPGAPRNAHGRPGRPYLMKNHVEADNLSARQLQPELVPNVQN